MMQSLTPTKPRMIRWFVLGMLAVAATLPAFAETCSTGSEIQPATRGAIEQAARQYLDMAARGDVFNLKQSSIPALAGNFAGIEQAAIAHKEKLAEVPPSIRGAYLLDVSTATTPTIARAEFYCGIFNSPDRVGFVLNNLPKGRYAIVIQDVRGKSPITLSLILQDMNGWKLAGFYVRPGEANGHDGQWYWNQARQYAAKGQKHNAWLYFVEARDLLAPVPFMTSVPLDKLYDETQAAMPPDFPVSGPITINGADGKAYQLTSIFPLAIDEGLSLVIRQQVPDASDTSASFQANMGVMKAVLAKWPELREAFTSVVARAQDAAGRDYGSLLKMADIK